MKWPSVNPLLLKQNSFMIPFLLTSCFRAHPITILLKILGADAWAVPSPQIFGGTVPPALPKSPPMRAPPERSGNAHAFISFYHIFLPPNVGFPTQYF